MVKYVAWLSRLQVAPTSGICGFDFGRRGLQPRTATVKPATPLSRLQVAPTDRILTAYQAADQTHRAFDFDRRGL